MGRLVIVYRLGLGIYNVGLVIVYRLGLGIYNGEIGDYI